MIRYQNGCRTHRRTRAFSSSKGIPRALPRHDVNVLVDSRLRVRRTLRNGDASAGDERDEDQQEG